MQIKISNIFDELIVDIKAMGKKFGA